MNAIQRISTVVGIMLVLGGCASTEYITRRDVPISPSVTVLKTYDIQGDMQYVTKLEKILIKLGISVVQLRHSVISELTGETLVTTDKSGTQSVSERMVVDKRITEVTTSHIVKVDSVDRSLKVINSGTNEVLAVLSDLSNPKYKNAIEEKRVRKTFEALGFQVRAKEE